MKSSFKSTIEKNTMPDGSIELTFKHSFLSATANATGAAGSFMFWVVLIPSCAVTSPLISKMDMFSGLLVWTVLTWTLAWVIIKQLVKANGRIIIVPGEGLRWGRNQLPFSDIKEISSSIDRAVDTNVGVTQSSAYVFAVAHGQEIKITRYVPEHLASTLVDEISPFLRNAGRQAS
jgi:hypothetical protein